MKLIFVVVKTPNEFVPIEAKIYAGDQHEQCADYLSYASAYYDNDTDVTLYYLTIDKHEPSGYSLAGKHDLMEQIRLISWGDILDWLLSIENLKPVEKELVGQFSKALEILLNRKRRRIEMSIDEMINSPEGMKAAMEIEKSINRKKTALLHKIFEDIIRKVAAETDLNYDPKLNQSWDYKKGLDDYYSRRRSSSTYPALTYNMGQLDVTNDGTEHYLIIRFEVEWRPYVGFAIMRRNKAGEIFTEDKPSEDLIAKAKAKMVNPNLIAYDKDWWLYWEYVISNNQEISDNEPEFRNMNEAYLSLYDENNRSDFVDSVVSMLKKFSRNVKS